MRNPGRRDGDDARAGSTDPTVPQAGSDGGPADDDLVGMRASDSPRTTEPHRADHASPAGNDDVGGLDGDLGNDLDGTLVDDLDLDLDAGPADMDDDLLFDPLLSDEPIDLAAVRADDALIDALSGGDLAGADDLADDDPLIAMLAAWAASARPDAAAAPHSTDPDAARSRSASAAGDRGSHRRDRRRRVGRRWPPGCPDGEHRVAGRRGPAGRRAGHRTAGAGRGRRCRRAPPRPGSAHRPAGRSAPSHGR